MLKIVSPEDLPRSLTCFEKSSEKYVGIIPLPKVNLKEIQKLWNEPEDEPMVDCYPLQTREQIEFFEEILRYKLKIEQYDYFLEIGKAQIEK